tara:strand:+ start:149308 stop:149850 length:543 start_codon:yes stop_codon:yes gene_type:complete
MSDFPEKAPDNTNAVAVVVIGLATTAVLWAFVVYLQAYFETTEGEIAASRASMGRSALVRDLKAEQRADLAKTTYADASKGTLKRLNVETAMSLVVRDAKTEGSLIPSLGVLNCPTIPASAGRPADDSAINPCAPAAPAVDGADEAAATDGEAAATGDEAAVPAATGDEAPAPEAPTPAQ